MNGFISLQPDITGKENENAEVPAIICKKNRPE
jgi:hypothetical protein